MIYQAFLSYSHTADAPLSAAVQAGLHGLGKAWYQRRAIRVFRDKTSLSANPALWPSIEKALAASEYFLLLASPQAAQSSWVRREVDWWLSNRPAERLLILLTQGEIVWDAAGGDFDWARTSALPDVLRGRFPHEPLFVDFRWAAAPEHLSLRHTQFRAGILDIAATVRGIPKDELDGEDVRQHRRTRLLATAMVVGIVAFAVMAAWQAYAATVQRGIATLQRNMALSRLLAGESLRSSTDPLGRLDAGLLLGVAAYRIEPTSDAQRSLITALLEANRVRKFVHTSDTLTSLALSPDGSTIATGDTSGHIRFWSARTLQSTLDIENGKDFVQALAFSPDGAMLAAVDAGQLRLWRIADGKATPVRAFKANRRMTKVAWSPNGAHVYVIDDVTRQWDAASGVEATALDASTGRAPRWLAVAPDGRTIATAGDDPVVHLWDAATGRLRRTLQGLSPSVRSLAFNRDGTRLASGGSDGRIAVWDVATGERRSTFEGLSARAAAVAFSPDDSMLASGHDNRMVILWNAKTGELAEALPGHTNGLLSLAFAPDAGALVSVAFNQTFIVWNLGVPAQRAWRTGHDGEVRSLAVSPDGATLASAGEDGTIRLWDVAAARERAVLTGHRGEVRALAFNPVSGVLVSGGEDRTLRFWSTQQAQLLEEVDAHGEVESLAISPDGMTLAWSAGSTSPIFLWDTVARQERGELAGHGTDADSLEFSRDGERLVSAGGSSIMVWDHRTGRQVVEPLEVGAADKAAISPDGTTIASSQTFPESVLFWTLQGGADPIELPAPSPRADKSPVFSPDGTLLAYSTGEAALGVVLLRLRDRVRWTIETPASIARITFSPDGKRLITGHSNGGIGIWDAEPERWPERACEVANRNLTRAEWRELAGEDLTYVTACPGLPVPDE